MCLCIRPTPRWGGAWGLELPLAPIYAAQRERGLQLLEIIAIAIPVVIILVDSSARLFTDALKKRPRPAGDRRRRLPARLP